MEPEKTSFIMYSALFIILTVLALWIVKPFILSIIAGVIIAYIFHPVYLWILKRLRSKGWSAFIVTILIIIIFTVPIFFIAQEFAKDAYVSYVVIKQKFTASFFAAEPCIEKNIGCSISNWVKDLMNGPQAKTYLEDALAKVTNWAIGRTSAFVSQIPNIILQIFVMMFVVYYSLKDGDKLVKKIIMALPLKKHHYSTIVRKTKEMIFSTVYGMLLVAAIQGLCAGIGFFIFGVKSPVLLGILTALAALLPVLGTAIVWGPTVAVYFFDSLLSNNTTGIILSLGLLAYCIFPVSTIDNFVRPKIIGDRARVHPVLVLLGILGGVAAFGIVGLLIGPLIITLFVTFIDIYHQERMDRETHS
jgi:predicted PurR-regulated permease PerM